MKNTRKSVGTLAATLITFGSLAGGVEAAPVTFAYSGTIMNLNDPNPTVPPFNAFIGQKIHLSFTFDSALTDSNPSANGDYSPLISVTIQIGANTYTSSNAGSISVINNGTNPDQYIVNGMVTGPALTDGPDTYDAQNFNLILTDNSKSVFSSDVLPIAQPFPSDFTSGQLRIDFQTSSFPFKFGSVGTNTVIPIVFTPASIVPAHIIRFDTVTTRTYILQTTEDLLEWSDTAMQLVGDGNTHEFAVEVTKPKEFYRVRVQ
jgi:hypothetical protein